MGYGYLVNVQGNQKAEPLEGKKSSGCLRGYTEILRIFHAAAVILGIFMERMLHVQADMEKILRYHGKYAWTRLRAWTGCMRKHEDTEKSCKIYGYDERGENISEKVKPPGSSGFQEIKTGARLEQSGLQQQKISGMHKAGNKYRDRRLLNQIKQVPCGGAKSNKQWVGTCLYQEGYKSLLINCGAVIRCRAA